MIKVKEFELSLIPKNNPYYKLGLICNPFCSDASAKQEFMRGLKNGIPKSSLKKFLPRVGLSDECVKEIIKRVRAQHRYHIRIEWDDKAQTGSLQVTHLCLCLCCEEKKNDDS